MAANTGSNRLKPALFSQDSLLQPVQICLQVIAAKEISQSSSTPALNRRDLKLMTKLAGAVFNGCSKTHFTAFQLASLLEAASVVHRCVSQCLCFKSLAQAYKIVSSDAANDVRKTFLSSLTNAVKTSCFNARLQRSVGYDRAQISHRAGMTSVAP